MRGYGFCNHIDSVEVGQAHVEVGQAHVEVGQVHAGASLALTGKPGRVITGASFDATANKQHGGGLGYLSHTCRAL